MVSCPEKIVNINLLKNNKFYVFFVNFVHLKLNNLGLIILSPSELSSSDRGQVCFFLCAGFSASPPEVRRPPETQAQLEAHLARRC
jgi:hypothetical protein